MEPFDQKSGVSPEADDNSERGLLDLTRRGFLGATVGATLAAGAQAQSPGNLDELRLDFVEHTEAGRRYLSIQVVEGESAARQLARAPQQKGDEAQKPVFREKVFNQDKFWDLPLDAFGPESHFVLRRSVSDSGLLSYRVRIYNVEYGRLRNRTIAFYFVQKRTTDRVGLQRLMFVLSAFSRIWSSQLDATSAPGFWLEAKQQTGATGTPANAVPFAEFLDKEKDIPLVQTVPAERITKTAYLMFNGLFGHPPRGTNETVSLSFFKDGRWRIARLSAGKPPLTALGGRLMLSAMTIKWDVATGDEVRRPEATLVATGEVARTEDGPQIIVVGGHSGPSLQLVRLDQDDGKVRFRMLRPQKDVGSGAQMRAEAVYIGNWQASTRDRPQVGFAGPFPTLHGAVLERVDASPAPSAANPASAAGSISFLASFPADTKAGEPSARLTSLDCPVGRLVVTAIEESAGEEAPEGGDSATKDWPERKGWPVQALFSWGPGRSANARGLRPTRSLPATDWIEFTVALIEAGIRLGSADYSRLTFAPSELRLFYAAERLASPPLGSFVDLGAIQGNEIARLDLSRATLRASRSHHLLALTFRFSELALSLRHGRATIIRLNPLCDVSGRTEVDGATRPHDTRPVMVVEFPGQHLFEEARFVPSPPPMADVSLNSEVTIRRSDGAITNWAAIDPSKGRPTFKVDGSAITIDSDNRVHLAEALRMLGKAKHRKTFRSALQKKKGEPQPSATEYENRPRNRFRNFANRVRGPLERLRNRSGLPDDQTAYIGPYALDADAMSAARQLHEAMFLETITDVRDEMFRAVDANTLTPPVGGLPSDVAQSLQYEARLESAIPEYQLFRTFYRETMLASFLQASSTDLGQLAARTTNADETEFFEAARKGGPVWMTVEDRKLASARFEKLSNLFISELAGRESVEGPMRGRLARPSRLAFRINCLDGIDAARVRVADLDTDEDAAVRLPRQALDFDLDALTNFKEFELAVTRRAEVVYDGGALGLIDGRHIRAADRRPGAMLDHLGFERGPGVTAAMRMARVAGSLTAPESFETAIEIPARLILSPDQNAVVLTPKSVVADIFDATPRLPPSAARALPRHRLWAARFMTGKDDTGLDPGLRVVFSPDLRPEALLGRSNYGAPKGSDRLRSPGAGAPPRGPVAPWYLSRYETQNGEMTPDEAIRIVLEARKGEVGQSNPDDCVSILNDPEIGARYPGIVAELCRIFARRKPESGFRNTFRSSIDAYVRHELVILSSAWGLPVVGRRNADMSLQEQRTSSQEEPAERHQLKDVWPGSAIYRPRTLNVSELVLTTLGGTLRHDTGFEPPAAAQFWIDRSPLFDALSIERWQQWINIGRDIYTEVVYKGFLFPLGLRASLVQVTERTFFVERSTGIVTSVLRQRMFIRVAQPEKSFPALKQPFQGRAFPVGRLKLLTTTTPDIVDPATGPVRFDPNGSEMAAERANGRIDILGGTGIVFWPRVIKSRQGNIRFEMDIDGVKTDLPLIFIDNTAVNDPTTLERAINYYNEKIAKPDATPAAASVTQFLAPLLPEEHLRSLRLHGTKRRYAPEIEAGSASYQTDHWTLRAVGGFRSYGEHIAGTLDAVDQLAVDFGDRSFDALRMGADQPPFYPAIEAARLHLKQTERLVGRPLGPVQAHFDARYVVHGFPAEGADAKNTSTNGPVDSLNPNMIFMFVASQPLLTMGNKGDQSGGVFRPEGRVVALSRLKGAMTRGEAVAVDASVSADELLGVSALFAFERSQNGGRPSIASAPAPAIAAQPPAGAPQDNVENVRKIYEQFFSPNAKILGLVAIRDLIRLVENLDDPDQGLPQLVETMEFGAGLDEGARDATMAIREDVIAPLAAAIRRVREGWDRIQASIAEAQKSAGISGGMAIAVAEVFPELDRSLHDLDVALGRAEETTDAIGFALALGGCYGAGQRFLDAVQRTAANPGERIEAALSARFGAVLSLFRDFESGREKQLEQLLGGLTAPSVEYVKTEAQALFEKLVHTDAVFMRSRELLPIPRSSGWYSPDGTFDKGMKSEMDMCLNTILPPAEWAQNVLSEFAAFAVGKLIQDTGDTRNIGFGGLLYDFLIAPIEIPLLPNTDPDQLVSALKKKLGDIREHAEEKWTSKLSAPEIERILRTLEIQFEAILDTATKQLTSRTVAEQIRNQYIASLILGLLECKNTSFQIELARYLPRLMDVQEVIVPRIRADIAEILLPAYRLLSALQGMFGAIRAIGGPDFDALLVSFQNFLDEIGVPMPSISAPVDLCSQLDPVWKAIQPALNGLADLGENTSFCPPGSMLPTCPISSDDYTNLADATTDEGKTLTGAKPSLCKALLIVAAESKAVATLVGEKAAALKATLTDVQTAIAAIAPEKPPTGFMDQLANLIGGAETSLTCITDLHIAADRAYCAVQEDSAALESLTRDLRAAAKLEPCINGKAEAAIIGQIKALANLPRDARRVAEARQNTLLSAEKFIQTAIDTASIAKQKTGEDTFLIPLAITLPGMLTKYNLKDPPPADIAAPNWAAPYADVKASIEKLQSELGELTAPIARTSMAVADAVCMVAKGVDDHVQRLRTTVTALQVSLNQADPKLITLLRKHINIETATATLDDAEALATRIGVIVSKLCPSGTGAPPTFATLGDFDLDALARPSKTEDSPLKRLAELTKEVTTPLADIVEEIRPLIEAGARNDVLKLFDGVVKLLPIAPIPNNLSMVTLSGIYGKLLEERDKFHTEASKFVGETLAKKLLVLPDPARGEIATREITFTPATSTESLNQSNDQLAGDAAWIAVLVNGRPLVASADPSLMGPLTDPRRFAFLSEFVREWGALQPTPLEILIQLQEMIKDLLTGEFFRAIDFRALRAEFEDYLLALVPQRIRMGYDFDIELGDKVKTATAGIFAPAKAARLTIDMQIVVDLGIGRSGSGLGANPKISFGSVGTLGAFDIKLIGDMFDALTLKFAGARFESQSGQKSRFDIEYLDYKIGPELSFLEDLQSFLSPKDGSGAFVRFDPSQPGVEAGYRLQLGDFTVGNLAISNVGLETSAILPFSDSEALFRASLSSRVSPFTLTYAPYGGSGFFSILANTKGIIGFEASFEFGGSAVFAFGPLNGQGRLMMGVYIRQLTLNGSKLTEISMTFFAGGSASIWIFNFAAALSLKMGMINGAMTGEATFSFSFSMGLADFEYSVRMQKQEGKGFSGQQAQLYPAGATRYAKLGSPAQAPHSNRDVWIRTTARCQAADWNTFKRNLVNWEPVEGYF